MEVRNVQFTGLGRAISDIDCQDGELSVSHNIIRDNGAMRLVWVPGDSMALGEGEELVYIHRTSEYKHYIVRNDVGLFYFTDDNLEYRGAVAELSSDLNISLSSLGNTLIVSSIQGISYVLFKDDSYKYLGEKPPETVISFKLYSYLYTQESDSYVINHEDAIITNNNEGVVRYEIKEDYVDLLTERESALVAKLINDAKEDNKIVHPCLVRYAYRLFDGSLIMHSSPVLLVPNTKIAPVVTYPYKTGTSGVLTATSFASDVIFTVKEDVLGDWKDVISSIDIYMSEQISTRNYDSKIRWTEKLSDSEAGQSMHYGYGFAEFGKYAPVSFYDAYSSRYPESLTNYVPFTLYGEDIERTDLHEIVKSTSNFYKVRSIDVNEISTEDVNLFGNEDDSQYSLSSLVTGESMTDDYRTHDLLKVEYLFPYNQRLNVSGVNRVLYKGYDTTSMVADVIDEDEEQVDYTVFTHIKKDGKEIIVQNECSGLDSFYPMYLFYPDPDAYKMTIIKGLPPFDTSMLYEGFVANLEEHKYLNGAVYFNNFKVVPEVGTRRFSVPSTTSAEVSETNKIYTSEVGNPYYFPLSGINTVGVGNIKGVSSVTQALSQGQFGQFPLYVFSTDGIWAMEVGKDGLYSAVKPVSRDVCINGDSITQTDNSVLFVTEKGVMVLDGSSVTCISLMMNGRSFDSGSVAMLGALMDNEGIPSDLQGKHDFMDYARDARMAYDYSNNRILLFKEGEGYCYVFSLTDRTWGTLGVSVDRAVSDYPDVYIQHGRGVKVLSSRVDYDADDEIKTLIVTRPLKFGSDEFKTVYEVVARGAMERNKGGLFLWGSHDGETYVLLKNVSGNRMYRTGGSGYRYYRIGIVGSMKVGETLSMASVAFRPKYRNRLR